MSDKNYDSNPRWYVVHTYSGYENKVKTDLENKIKNRENGKRYEFFSKTPY